MSYRESANLLGKIEFEGGVVETIVYGITHRDVPAEVAEEWERLEGLLGEVEELSAAITARLEISAVEAEIQAETWEDEFGDDDDEEDE